MASQLLLGGLLGTNLGLTERGIGGRFYSSVCLDVLITGALTLAACVSRQEEHIPSARLLGYGWRQESPTTACGKLNQAPGQEEALHHMEEQGVAIKLTGQIQMGQ